jgi:hypothetical protein
MILPTWEAVCASKGWEVAGMTDDAREKWSEVGERFSSWGRRVADRYHGDEPAPGSEAEEEQQSFQRAAKEAIDEIARGVSAFGKTVRDDEANRELGDALKALGEAIAATFEEAASSIRSGGAKGGGGSDGGS